MQSTGVKQLRQALCDPDFNLHTINDALITVLTNALISSNEELQSDAAWFDIFVFTRLLCDC